MSLPDVQVIIHGADHPDYFQGCGTAFSDYNFCVTGCGMSAKQAFEDALDQLADACDHHVDHHLTAAQRDFDSKSPYDRRIKITRHNSESRVFVSIRWV